MKVLLLFWGGGRGGDAVVAIALAQELKERDDGFVLVAYAYDDPEVFRAKAETAGLTFKEDFFLVSDPAEVWAETGLKRGDFGLIHVHHGRTVPKRTDIVPLRRVAGGLRMVLTAHGPMPLRSIDYGGLKSRLSRILSPIWFAAIIVPSEAKAREWRGMTPLASRVIAIPNIFNHLTEMDKSESRQELGLSNDAEVALFCSRLDADKDPECFIRAVHEASKKRPQLIGLMAGSGKLADRCDALIQDLGAPVKKVGYVQDPSPYYSAADLFVQPSLYESFGITLLQAAEMGMPCVASDIEVFRDLYGGLDSFQWFEPQNHVACAEGLVAQLENHPDTSPQQNLRTRFTADAVVDAHRRLYRRVLGVK